MKKIVILIFTIIVFNFSYGKVGKSGMGILTLPTSASSAGTMEVFEQNSNSSLSLFKKPTGLPDSHPMIAFTHNIWFADITSEALSLSIPSRFGTFGIGGNFLRVPGVEVRNNPTENPLNEIEAQYFSGNIGYSRRILQDIEIGLGLKYLYESNYIESANGVAADIGINWISNADLNISLAFNNIGKMEKLDKRSTSLGQTISLGIVRPEIFNESVISASIGIKFESNMVSEEAGGQIGTQVELYDLVVLRGGFETYGDVQKKSFGFGIKYKEIKIEYSTMVMDNMLSNPKLISFGYLF